MDRHKTKGQPKELQKSLKNRHIQLIAIGGAIGTGLFMGSGRTISLAGPSILLVYTIAGVALFFFMRCMGEMFLAKPNMRSFVDIANTYMGPWGGVLLAWTYWLCWTGVCVADMVAITGYFRFWWPEIPVWLPVLGTIILLFTLNSLTVKAFGETEFWFSMIKIVAIIALILIGLGLVAAGHTGEDGMRAAVSNLWSHGGFFPNGMVGFLTGFQIAIFAFAGVELVGTTVAESENPQRSLPKAINSIPIRIIIFYVGALSVIMMVNPWDVIDPETSPFVTMFAAAGLPAAAGIINLVVITSAASSANSGVFSTSRMIFGLSRSGEAPKIFGKLSRYHVPQNALLLTAAMSLVSIVVMEFGGSIMEAFILVTSTASVLFMSVWAMITYCYIIYRKREPEVHAKATFKAPGGSISAVLVLIFFAVITVILIFSDDTRIGMISAIIWLVVVGTISYIRQRSGRMHVIHDLSLPLKEETATEH
ncbi:amino acid permease [Corynebacterium caspium]|uniref:amino acid permease n=1 Tax=Corynebacterium caspium TaxID=234828 RepID=UPI000373D8E2|nr:amino acid permease [Corynebacterium caspium]WKD59792.1 D-serine/D-alanine/glycine transporter [Corynebacterium caspium DSM 44850]